MSGVSADVAKDRCGLVLAGAGYRYPSAVKAACTAVDLRVEPGEIVLLTGPTGCGKSTLLRLCAGLVQRHGAGRVSGQIRVGGRDPARTAPSERVLALGLVGQEPADQLVAATIGDELAFALESAGRPPQEIEARIPELLRTVGLDLPLERDPRSLSGGQLQRLAVASALSAGAACLVLDEPLAQLDPVGAQSLLVTLREVADQGVAVLLVEHRLPQVWDTVDRLVLMEAGRVVGRAARQEILPGHPLLATMRRLGLRLPGLLDLADRQGLPRDSVEKDLTAALSTWSSRRHAAAAVPGSEAGALPVAHLSVPAFTYRGATAPSLLGIELTLHAGERVALLGGNGAGKSTLLGLLSGALRLRGLQPPPDVVGVPQDPDLALFQTTVQAELAYGPSERRSTTVQESVDQAASALSITDLLDAAPQALSRGQRLRVAVAAALSCGPRLLVLDEPTSGQDHDQVEAMLGALTTALADGVLIFASHDVDLALRHATRVIVLHAARVVADGPPAQVLTGLSLAVPLVLPPLAAACLAQGHPVATAAELATLLKNTAEDTALDDTAEDTALDDTAEDTPGEGA